MLDRPNIQIYTSHDTGRQIGPYAAAPGCTPRAQHFAEEGGLFERVFAERPQSDAMRAVRTNGHKLIRNFHGGPGVQAPVDVMAGPSDPDNLAAVQTPRVHPPVELYDLEADPFEQRNLAEEREMRPVRDALDRALARWMRDTDDSLLDGPIANPLYHHSRRAVQRRLEPVDPP